MKRKIEYRKKGWRKGEMKGKGGERNRGKEKGEGEGRKRKDP